MTHIWTWIMCWEHGNNFFFVMPLELGKRAQKVKCWSWGGGNSRYHTIIHVPFKGRNLVAPQTILPALHLWWKNFLLWKKNAPHKVIDVYLGVDRQQRCQASHLYLLRCSYYQWLLQNRENGAVSVGVVSAIFISEIWNWILARVGIKQFKLVSHEGWHRTLWRFSTTLKLSLIRGLHQEYECAAACVRTTHEGWWHVVKCGSIPLMEDGIEGIKLENGCGISC